MEIVSGVDMQHDANESPYDWTKKAANATLTVLFPFLGLLLTLIQVQGEPAKLRNMVAALLATFTAVAIYLIWRLKKRGDYRKRALILIMLAYFAVALLTVGLALALSGEQTSPGRPSAIEPSMDIRMHEVWASSAENVARLLKQGEWAMTDFPATAPYLRSVEVAVGPSAEPNDIDRVLLIVYDEHQQEIASGEADIQGYRAKFVFEKPVDIHDYLGKRLFLQVRNIYTNSRRVYLTNYDKDRSVTSYISCGAPKAVSCPNPQAQDLSTLVVGRSKP